MMYKKYELGIFDGYFLCSNLAKAKKHQILGIKKNLKHHKLVFEILNVYDFRLHENFVSLLK